MRIRKIRIVSVTSPEDWWFHQNLVGEEFNTITPVAVGKNVEVHNKFGFKSYVPLAACIINPHLRLIKGGRQ